MTLLELFSLIVSFILLVILYFKKYLTLRNILLVSTTILIVTLSFYDSFKWMYYLLYFFLFTTALYTVFNILSITHYRKTLLTLSSLSFALGFSLIFTFPVNDIPKPTGSYLIGTTAFDITDYNRMEQYNESDDNRKIRIQLWYPTDSIEGLELSKWHYDGVESVRGLSIDNYFPSFFLDENAKIDSNSYLDAEVSNLLDSYPVIIISHGWRSQRTLHTDIAEELASNGYIVVGIEHTYGSVATVFEDGTVAYKDPNALPWDDSFLQKANQLVNTYADDVTLTLDYLETLNSTNSVFTERLDLSKIGLLGHSTGGGGDVIVSIKDNRIKSFIGLDPWVEPIDETVLSQGIKVPSLILRSNEWETGDNNANLSILLNNSETFISLYQIENTTHLDFSMMYMYSPLIKAIGFSGSIDSLYLSDMLKTVATSFFNETLNEDYYEHTPFDSYPEMIKIEKP